MEIVINKLERRMLEGVITAANRHPKTLKLIYNSTQCHDYVSRLLMALSAERNVMISIILGHFFKWMYLPLQTNIETSIL